MPFDIQSYNPFDIRSDEQFNEIALELFRFQYENNKVYGAFVDGLGIKQVSNVGDIPFLPIEFFKTREVVSADGPFDKTFLSSGTTGTARSKHLVKNIEVYKNSFAKGIQIGYPDVEERAILALLPNYLEQGDSSLVYMVSKLIEESSNQYSGFYLRNYEELKRNLVELDRIGHKSLLIGVSYALLDLVEETQIELKNTIVMETGGMKGRRKEMVRSELHHALKNGFGVDTIHSEYGMTELLSQAYSKGDGIFECPPWMKVSVRDVNDPLQHIGVNRSGGINVIDLANIYSCSFLATQDLGKTYSNGTFEVIGRFDNSDIRGCNLMVE